MATASLDRALRQDRATVLASIAVLTALAWLYLLLLAGRMDMAGEGMMMEMMGPSITSWSAGDFLFMFTMWAVMMVGMMLPSVAPMVLLYASVARRAAAQGSPLPASGWFAGGYLLSWTLFALAATAAQWALEQAALLSPTTMAMSGTLGGVVLVGAGLYQWTPLKDACLAQCQAPLVFIQRHGGFRREASGSVHLGMRHGFYCIGCCWALMALLFVVGIMNILWIAALAAFVLIEKVAPGGRVLSRLSGAALVAAGFWMVATV